MDATVTLYRKGKRVAEPLPMDQAAAVSQEPDAFVWIDLPHPHEDVLESLQGAFGLHPLAVEDAVHARQRPKIEQYEGFFALVAYAAAVVDASDEPDEPGEPGERIELREITAYISRHFAITVRHEEADDLADLRVRLDHAAEPLTNYAGGFFGYALLDHVVDGYFIAVDELQDRVETLEERLVYGPDASTGTGLEEAFASRHDVILFRRAVAPLREVLNVLMRRDDEVLAVELDDYVRDLYDHVVRVSEDLDTAHDLISAALEAHLSVVSNQMNEVVLKVSAWAAIIALPTVIASIYGMNFVRMPELHWHLGYPYALTLMAGSAIALFTLFKRHHWL
jgi:magnesium transporter